MMNLLQAPEHRCAFQPVSRLTGEGDGLADLIVELHRRHATRNRGAGVCACLGTWGADRHIISIHSRYIWRM